MSEWTVTDVETGSRPRLDQSAVFQSKVRLNCRSQADLVLPACPPDRRNPIARPQNAAFNQLVKMAGDALVKRFDSGMGESAWHEIGILNLRPGGFGRQLQMSENRDGTDQRERKTVPVQNFVFCVCAESAEPIFCDRTK